MAGMRKNKEVNTKSRLETERKEASNRASIMADNERKILAHLQANYPGFKKFWRANYSLRAHNVFDNSFRINIWNKVEYGYTMVWSTFMVWTGDGVVYSNPSIEEKWGR